MTARSLRAVAPDEKPAKGKPKTVTEAAASSRRELLVATRDRVARAVDNPSCPPRDLAALTRRLTDIAKEIEALDAAAKMEAAEGASVPDEAFDASAI